MRESKRSAVDLGLAGSLQELLLGIGLVLLLAGGWMLHPGLGVMLSGGAVILIARGLAGA